jgi:hypothetical protein
MFVNKRTLTCGKLLLLSMISICMIGFSKPTHAQEDLFSTSVAETEVCGPASLQPYTALANLDGLSSDVLIKTNAANLKTSVSVYIQDNETARCTKIGQAVASDDGWARIGKIDKSETGERTFLVSGENLGADIYASVATVLIVPSGVCIPRNLACEGEFSGRKGAIEPITISQPGEFITVQTVQGLESEKILYVEYYDGGEFLYESSEIAPVDKRYLRGGTRTVKTVVYFTNNRLLTITDEIKMPTDPLYSQYVKSSFFRLGSQTRVVLILLVAGVVVWLIVALIRYIHRRRTYRNGHGIDAYLRNRTNKES